jgi:hypothetical protein
MPSAQEHPVNVTFTPVKLVVMPSQCELCGSLCHIPTALIWAPLQRLRSDRTPDGGGTVGLRHCTDSCGPCASRHRSQRGFPTAAPPPGGGAPLRCTPYAANKQQTASNKQQTASNKQQTAKRQTSNCKLQTANSKNSNQQSANSKPSSSEQHTV